MTTPLLTAFSTSSSNATLRLTMEAVEINDGVSNKIASFTLPLGATVNMNGTALYECVAVIFIAQAYGVELTFAQQLIVIFTALLAAIGSAGIPMAGLIMMTVVLKAVGLCIWRYMLRRNYSKIGRRKTENMIFMTLKPVADFQ